MWKMIKKLTACLVVVALMVPNLLAFAQDPTARNLSVFRVDGDDAFLTWGHGGRGVVPRSGQRLNVGNVMSTGFVTQVYMQLDAASIVKMDELSQVAVEAAGNRLSLTVYVGSALVEVEQLAPGHTLETRIGSTVMSVRGTLFVAGLRDDGTAVVTMLSGDGVVYIEDEAGVVTQQQPLRAGQVFWAHEDIANDFAVMPVDLQTMSLFELQETWNYREYLIQVGTLTPAMQQQLPLVLDARQRELEAERAALGLPFAPVPVTPPPTPPAQANVSVGDIIPFGGFNWRVLDVQGGRALIITDRVIDQRPYDHGDVAVTWETSEIRQWLNSEFFARFSLSDQARIAEAYVVNHNNPWDFTDWGGHRNTPGGNNTRDRIFLLSIDEVLRYLGDSGLVARGTSLGADARDADANPELFGRYIDDQYSDARMALDLGGSFSWWWLRSPGIDPYRAAIVGWRGYLGLIGGWVGWFDGGIRPALWLYL